MIGAFPLLTQAEPEAGGEDPGAGCCLLTPEMGHQTLKSHMVATFLESANLLTVQNLG